jgi:hypothetical protein
MSSASGKSTLGLLVGFLTPRALSCVQKLVGGQCLLQGINQPSVPVVNVNVERPPTMTDRITGAIEQLVAEQGPPDGSPPN